MNDNNFIQNLINNEIGGKNSAIHAYDKMIWTVRSGFLTLIFAGWSIVIKTAIESHADIKGISPYFFVLSAFSVSLAVGAYRIDRNYARRKFRVIAAVNHLIKIITNIDFNKIETGTKNELTELLQISGDADTDTFRSAPYSNEITISRIIYGVPSLLIAAILFYYFFIF